MIGTIQRANISYRIRIELEFSARRICYWNFMIVVRRLVCVCHRSRCVICKCYVWYKRKNISVKCQIHSYLFIEMLYRKRKVYTYKLDYTLQVTL